MSIPAGVLSTDAYVTVSSAPRAPLPSDNIEAVSRGLTISFAANSLRNGRNSANQGNTAALADVRISIAGLASRRLGAQAAILLEFSSPEGEFSFVAAPDASTASSAQPATVSLRRSQLDNVSQIRATLIKVTRLTNAIPPPVYLYVSGTFAAWLNRPNLAPHKRTLVLVHGINATADSTFPAACANTIRTLGNYDQVVGRGGAGFSDTESAPAM